MVIENAGQFVQRLRSIGLGGHMERRVRSVMPAVATNQPQRGLDLLRLWLDSGL